MMSTEPDWDDGTAFLRRGVVSPATQKEDEWLRSHPKGFDGSVIRDLLMPGIVNLEDCHGGRVIGGLEVTEEEGLVLVLRAGSRSARILMASPESLTSGEYREAFRYRSNAAFSAFDQATRLAGNDICVRHIYNATTGRCCNCFARYDGESYGSPTTSEAAIIEDLKRHAEIEANWLAAIAAQYASHEHVYDGGDDGTPRGKCMMCGQAPFG